MELISIFDYRKRADISSAKEGNKEAFLSLAEQNRLAIYRVGRGILNSEEDIKDAMQTTLMKAFENINTLKKDKYFKTWLIRIMINECKEILRKNKKCILWDETSEQGAENHIDQYGDIDLLQAIQALSEELRIVITLFYFDDFSVKDISAILEISQGTVKSRLNRARAKIREILGEDE